MPVAPSEVGLATFSQFNFVVDAASVRQWALATFDADAGSVGHESPDLERRMFFRSTGEVPDTIEDDSIGYGGAMANGGSVSHVLGLTAMGSAEDQRVHGRLVREWMS